ncbi:MAG TPA: hypothetical protein VK648_00455, partial [Gemmatimonadaceae bacterium]|nr:hypothetical protein [Gemmatimonadaceae bacterium]
MRRNSVAAVARAVGPVAPGVARPNSKGSRRLVAKAFIHESAYVDEGAQVGSDTRVWHFCHVLGGAKVGERCSLGQNVVVMNGVRIGNNVK